MSDISEKTGAVWHNLNLGFKISINTGVGMIVWAVGFFLLTHMTAHHETLVPLYGMSLLGWTTGLGGFIWKRREDKKIALKAELAKLGVQDGATGK